MRINPKIEQALKDTGMPWWLEQVRGHFKIRLNGKLVGVMSTNNDEAYKNSTKNVVSQIRKAAREMTNDHQR